MKWKKRAISKHFFHKEPITEKKVYDKRLVNKALKEGIDPETTAYDYDNIDTKIMIYEDQVKTWFLDVAKYLMLKNKAKLQDGSDFDTNEAGFVILQIALSYFEGNQQYREGKTSNGESREFFRRGFERIFSEVLDAVDNKNQIVNNIYEHARCGLFHDGMTRSLISLNASIESSLEINKNYVTINPHRFLDSIELDFKQYIESLRDSTNTILRNNFEHRWNLETMVTISPIYLKRLNN